MVNTGRGIVSRLLIIFTYLHIIVTSIFNGHSVLDNGQEEHFNTHLCIKLPLAYCIAKYNRHFSANNRHYMQDIRHSASDNRQCIGHNRHMHLYNRHFHF